MPQSHVILNSQKKITKVNHALKPSIFIIYIIDTSTPHVEGVSLVFKGLYWRQLCALFMSSGGVDLAKRASSIGALPAFWGFALERS